MDPARLFRAIRRRRILREGASIAVGQGFSLVGRLLGLRLITALVPPSVYGDVILLLGTELLVFGVCCGPFLQAAIRFYPDAAREDRTGALRALVSSLLRRSEFAGVVLLLAGGGAWVAGFHGSTPYLLFPVLGVLLLVEARRSVNLNLLNAARQQQAYALWSTSDAWARPLGAVACILLIGPTAESILIGYASGTLLVNVVLGRLIAKPGVGQPAASEAGEWRARMRRLILRFSLPMVPQPPLNWFVNLGDRYILAGMTNTAETGVYSAAYGLASQPFILLAAVVANTLRPVLFEAVSAENSRKVARTLLVWIASLLGCFAVGLSLLWLLSDEIVRLVLGKAFWRASPLLIWIGLAYAVQGIQLVFSTMILARRRTEFLIVVQLVTAACALSLYLVWIPRYGALGAALGTLGANCAALVVAAVLSGVVGRRGRVAAAPS